MLCSNQKIVALVLPLDIPCASEMAWNMLIGQSYLPHHVGDRFHSVLRSAMHTAELLLEVHVFSPKDRAAISNYRAMRLRDARASGTTFDLQSCF